MKKLIDSNLIIYSAYPEYSYLRALVANPENYVSAISKVEVLGFKGLQEDERLYYESVFSVLQTIEIDATIIEKTIEVRQRKRVKLGDAIIIATALIYQLEVNTRNTKDFELFPELKIFNPIKESK